MPQRQDVVNLMTNVINDLNFQKATQDGVDEMQIRKAIADHQEELNFINGVLVDALKANNLISVD
jgi:hypothetical protein